MLSLGSTVNAAMHRGARPSPSPALPARMQSGIYILGRRRNNRNSINFD
jgi:hypothetical protein